MYDRSVCGNDSNNRSSLSTLGMGCYMLTVWDRSVSGNDSHNGSSLST